MIPIRDENPSHGIPFITLLLIFSNGFVFFYQYFFGPIHPERFLFEFGILPIEVMQNENLPNSSSIPPYLSLFTSMFLHGGFGHILGNMWYLWIFGDNLEDYFGHWGFLTFYLVTGLAAGLTHVFMNPSSEIPTIGASGAISGVLGGYMILHPRIRIKTLMFFGFFIQMIYVPAFFFLGIWFIMQLLGGLGPSGGIAFGAHIGGFVAGVFYLFLCTRRTPVPTQHPYDPHRHRRW